VELGSLLLRNNSIILRNNFGWQSAGAAHHSPRAG
jgi:hypothetical protein